MKNTDEKIIEMYTSGATQKEIVNECGRSIGNIYRVLERNNIPLRNPERAKPNKQKTTVKKHIKKCPHCKATINPTKARFCCMCGKDIRDEEDILREELEKTLTHCCTFLPANCVDEATEAIRKAIKYIERGSKK